ncbi:T-cell surface glycoprotein CD3 epsilon chain [Esox lucius]|uniref:CD3 gamma/delta subunit Ig-like domain-containing protein n=1 Tax=Esox lucius TaxID=8010 RepID=A0AAY5KMY9_ESOLU|nr:T-cell surface glycoprotein CD3 epsilon chain [Esox lucius]
MNRIVINGLLVFLGILTKVEGQGDVTFWRDKYTLTCPEIGEWYVDNELIQAEARSFDPIEIGNTRSYHCQYGKENIKHLFYIQGRGCENCYEVEMNQIAMVIVGDLILTGAVILIVYFWAQKKSGPATSQKPTSRSRGQAPVVSNVDYEPLRHGDRGKNIYAVRKNETKE